VSCFSRDHYYSGLGRYRLLRAKPETPLWVNMGTVNNYEAMSHPAKEAELKKRVSPHKF
jgi:hypothetical protein